MLVKHDQMLNCYNAHVCVKFDWSKTVLLPFDWSDISTPDLFQNCHFKINCWTENTLCVQLKNRCYPTRTCLLAVTTFYHLLHFGNSELHVLVHKFIIQAFCFLHLIIHWFVPSFPSRQHSVSFLYSFSCLHSVSFLYSFHSCIHFHAFHHHLYNYFKNYSFQVSFIFTFLYQSELLLKEDNDKYLKLASYQF